MLLSKEFLWLLLMFSSNFKIIVLTELVDNGHLESRLPPLEKSGDIIEKVFLKRKKRFLIFEKGAAVTFQGNIGKAIISGRPRGLNEIAEYTLTYDLPSQVDLKSLKTTTKPKPKTTATTRNTTRTSTPRWNYKDLKYYGKDNTNSYIKKEWQHSPPSLWCPKQHVFQKFYDKHSSKNLAWCTLKRRVKRLESVEQVQQINGETDSEHSMLLFDLITQMAKMHDLNPRHCIMRTLCESKHLLLPPGQLLFHDLVRILLSHAQPATQRHAPFRVAAATAPVHPPAIEHENFQECTQLYGLHCRWSLLQHFTEIFTKAKAILQ